MIGQPLVLELLFLTDCRTSGTMWATSRLAPPTILVNWPVTRFPSDVMGALAIALPITSSHRTYRP
jgi:hypothetical protein